MKGSMRIGTLHGINVVTLVSLNVYGLVTGEYQHYYPHVEDLPTEGVMKSRGIVGHIRYLQLQVDPGSVSVYSEEREFCEVNVPDNLVALLYRPPAL